MEEKADQENERPLKRMKTESPRRNDGNEKGDAKTGTRSAFDALREGGMKTNGGLKKEKDLKQEKCIREGDERVAEILKQKSTRQIQVRNWSSRSAPPSLSLQFDQHGPSNKQDFMVFVISKGRPSNVSKLHKLFQGECRNHLPTWIVGRGERADYERAGARRVVEGGGLCASRNMAIEIAKKEGKICVEMSDDITCCAILHQDEPWTKPGDDGMTSGQRLTAGNELAKSIDTLFTSPQMAAMYIECQMTEHGARLGGAYPTKNEGQAMNCPPTSLELFIVGDFLVIDPTSSPRFDEKMSLKEDYDLTAQHLKKYGKVARSNRVFITAQHYTNSGGAVAVRNDEREQYNIAVLRHKWPGVFPQHNTRGPNEVRMAWKRRGLELGGKKAVQKPKAPPGYYDDKDEGSLFASAKKRKAKGTLFAFFKSN